MLIRAATEADFDALAEITNHYIRTTPIHFGYQPVTGAELRESWQKNRDVFPFLTLVGADGTIIGYAKAGKWRERAAYDRTAEVGIYLHPAHHGRGWGKRLYMDLVEACRGAGMHTLVGGIAIPNPASVRLHESCGFTLAGTFREVGWKFEAWHDVAFYQLML